MADQTSWVFWIIMYELAIFVIVFLLGIGGVVGTEGIRSPSAITPDGAPLLSSSGEQHTCRASGDVNLEDPDVLLFTYVPSSTTLSAECGIYCINENTLGVYAYSCQGNCVNLTLNNGREFASCNTDPKGWFGVPDFLKFMISFYTLKVDLGAPQPYNSLITLILVYIPLLILAIIAITNLAGILKSIVGFFT